MAGERILFITRKWAPAIGGMETYCLRLVEHLRQTREVDVIALPGRSDGRPPSALALWLFPFVVLWKWLALPNRPDVVHVGDLAIWPIGLLAIVFAREATVIFSAHGTDISYSRRKGVRGTAYGLYQRIGARLLQRAWIIANSETTAQACAEHGWQRFSVVPLATDLCHPLDRHFSSTRLLFAGRMVKRKGLGWFVREVLPLLPSDVGIDVAGVVTDPAEASALQSERVRFLGPVEQKELAKRFAQALCVIVPNIERANGEFEGFGLVACEAAACGGVILAARTGGLQSAVRDGQTGFLLPAGDARAWAEKIERVRAWTPEHRIAFLERSRALAASHFSWERVAHETGEVYREARVIPRTEIAE